MKCLPKRDVCFREVLCQNVVCLREVSALGRCLCLRQMSVLERCTFQTSVFSETCLCQRNAFLRAMPILEKSYCESRLLSRGVSILENLSQRGIFLLQPKGFNLTPKDPRWIGNWWVGFLGAAGVTILSALFLLGFPNPIAGGKFRPGHDHKSSTVTGDQMSTMDDLTGKEKLRDLWCAVKELLTNWTFVLNCMAINCTLLYAEGLAPFIAKILILQYGVEPQKVGEALTVSAAPPLLSMQAIEAHI